MLSKHSVLFFPRLWERVSFGERRWREGKTDWERRGTKRGRKGRRRGTKNKEERKKNQVWHDHSAKEGLSCWQQLCILIPSRRDKSEPGGCLCWHCPVINVRNNWIHYWPRELIKQVIKPRGEIERSQEHIIPKFFMVQGYIFLN